jgi:hypothetical protein
MVTATSGSLAPAEQLRIKMRSRPIWVIDILGGLLTAAVLGTGTYYGVVQTEAAASDISVLTGTTRRLRSELVRLQSALDQSHAAAADSRAQLAQRGQLPRHSPVERDLQTLTQFARANRVMIAEVRPSGTVHYPGVTEVRYVLKGSGTFDALMGFFRSFEDSPFWADITHLRIDRAPAMPDTQNATRDAEISVSFFASVDAPPAAGPSAAVPAGPVGEGPGS